MGEGLVVPEPKQVNAEAEALKKEKEALEAKVKELESLPRDPDVTKAIEAARKEEKDKLYAQLNALKEKETGKSAELELLKQKHKEAQEQLAKLKAEGDNKGKTAEERIKDMEAKYEADKKAMMEDLAKEKVALQEILKKEQMLAFRERRIRETGGNLILELVTGNTEAEIEESIVKAKVSYEQMRKKVEEEIKAKLGASPAPAPLSPSVGAAGGASPGDVGSLKHRDLSRMSHDEYKKYRAEIFRERGLNPPQR